MDDDVAYSSDPEAIDFNEDILLDLEKTELDLELDEIDKNVESYYKVFDTNLIEQAKLSNEKFIKEMKKYDMKPVEEYQSFFNNYLISDQYLTPQRALQLVDMHENLYFKCMMIQELNGNDQFSQEYVETFINLSKQAADSIKLNVQKMPPKFRDELIIFAIRFQKYDAVSAELFLTYTLRKENQDLLLSAPGTVALILFMALQPHKMHYKMLKIIHQDPVGLIEIPLIFEFLVKNIKKSPFDMINNKERMENEEIIDNFISKLINKHYDDDDSFKQMYTNYLKCYLKYYQYQPKEEVAIFLVQNWSSYIKSNPDPQYTVNYLLQYIFSRQNDQLSSQIKALLPKILDDLLEIQQKNEPDKMKILVQKGLETTDIEKFCSLLQLLLASKIQNNEICEIAIKNYLKNKNKMEITLGSINKIHKYFYAHSDIYETREILKDLEMQFNQNLSSMEPAKIKTYLNVILGCATVFTRYQSKLFNPIIDESIRSNHVELTNKWSVEDAVWVTKKLVSIGITKSLHILDDYIYDKISTNYIQYQEKPDIIHEYIKTIYSRKKIEKSSAKKFLLLINQFIEVINIDPIIQDDVRKAVGKIEDSLTSSWTEERKLLKKIIDNNNEFFNQPQLQMQAKLEEDEMQDKIIRDLLK
ncbi:UNKNOWN [Stylonychia lemnae]|uniref:Uncharacterized protein n=1 Tax=Stylonychia lemnae TaxID=5949 RepID=A0A078A100_STYLE|nr:UNKNOWN [Stylonychia lemnae]|eukprot:CDW74459.1 UNKNOWN [Stylonychia lemnae]